MATPREVRRLAFQLLYQFDARGITGARAAEDAEAVRQSVEHLEDFSAAEQAKAFELALAAYNARQQADAAMRELAPTWPAHRQAAVDRAILRLAHFEMTSGRTHPKIVVNEAVELAKAYSTERSPAFINGLLDKILKGVLAEPGQDAPDTQAAQPDAPEALPGINP